jgi:cyclopropane fatty-acyl-phospholipid synthase-like methyltransferase
MADHYQNTIATWNKLARAYHEKFKDIRIYDDSYELFCSHLAKENPRILEIGCGPATATSWLKSRLPESKIRATDVSSEMIEEAKKHVKDVQFEVLDAREINIIEGKFDGIFSGFCIPYLTKEDLAPFIQSSSNLLLENGIIYLSCIEDAYENSTTQTGSTSHSMAVHYYEESDLIALFEASQLEKIETIRVNYPLLTGENQVHLIVIGRKN